MKQYFITKAYLNNYHVVRVNDGVVELDEILAEYELSGYTAAIEGFGYQKAEYVPGAELALKKAQESYERAKMDLEDAKKHPLKISEKDAKKYKLIEQEEWY